MSCFEGKPNDAKAACRGKLFVAVVDGTGKPFPHDVNVKIVSATKEDCIVTARYSDRTIAFAGNVPAGVYTLSSGDADVTAQETRAEVKAGNKASRGSPNARLVVTTAPLAIVKIDRCFAPKAETLDVQYSISGFRNTDKVWFRITSAKYNAGNTVIFEKELDETQKQDGSHTLTWDGKSSCKTGDLKEKYIHPLYSPYKAEIFLSDQCKDSKPFDVLYHSVELAHGAWTADEKEPPEGNNHAEKTRWVRYKLNALGYWAGPVDPDAADSVASGYLRKAILRYRSNHKDLWRKDSASYVDTVSDDLIKALKADKDGRSSFDGSAITDSTKKSRVMVECIQYLSNAEFQGWQAKKYNVEAQKLNRPLLPLEAVINLKGKAGDKKRVPEAVGPVRINWKATDVAEDLTRLHDYANGQPSYTKIYVEEALKVKGGVLDQAKNCPEEMFGLRCADYYKRPFLIGKSNVPYEAKDDSANKGVYVEACVDEAEYPKRVGKSGIFFRPSFIAGDAYQIRAEIDFADSANRWDSAYLKKAHGVTGDVNTRIHADTGQIWVWRTMKVAVVVNWPGRQGNASAFFQDDQWNTVADEYGRAYVLLDTSDIESIPITDVLTNQEYQDIVTANTNHTTPASITLTKDAMVGVALPIQNNLSAADYKDKIGEFVSTNFVGKIADPVREKIWPKLRKKYGAGIIALNFQHNKPVQVKKAPPGDVAVVDAAYVWGFSSAGKIDQYLHMDVRDPDRAYYVVAHEIGHANFLYHHENAGNDTTDEHHDIKDHNCIMSYSSKKPPDHWLEGAYNPHFCGKCNLRLRGWKVCHADMPKHNKKSVVLVLTVTAGAADVNEGDEVSFEIKVTNNGPDEATHLVLETIADVSHATFVSATPSAGTYSDNRYWKLNSLANAGSATLSYKIRAKAGSSGERLICGAKLYYADQLKRGEALLTGAACDVN